MSEQDEMEEFMNRMAILGNGVEEPEVKEKLQQEMPDILAVILPRTMTSSMMEYVKVFSGNPFPDVLDPQAFAIGQLIGLISVTIMSANTLFTGEPDDPDATFVKATRMFKMMAEQALATQG